MIFSYVIAKNIARAGNGGSIDDLSVFYLSVLSELLCDLSGRVLKQSASLFTVTA